ncbi:TetR/AcrR family transcriptional regulator [Dactylosporangium sp. AC04546]|uniref:TetR/AcrR family transcriptional regulator n=1 Tax=Dactylosporangium sp. AC04546 TaxID=2862460 RepID=UPI002E7B532D|nr:TetR/AcrR family transcriptional regulator [Dactylosporangium sp. AC04546]WVK86893.1 TetR/AcrR family transcriptional regulator [Dactylosporangium sp. AC04546]
MRSWEAERVGRTVGRSAQDTRRALLDAAAAVVRAKGIHASLDDIAQHAGVSKGGLLYHFASKDELVLALAEDHLRAFRDSVRAHLDADDDQPGRMTRAYIRALLSNPADEVSVRDAIMLIGQLMTIPAVAELARADSADLYAQLDADGLPEHLLMLVITSADGVSTAPLWGVAGLEDRYRDLERRLVELTLRPDLWDGLI